MLGVTGALLCVKQVEDDSSKKFEGTHFAIGADSKEQVDAFHAAALKAGWKDLGAPGIRKDVAPNWYAAFAVDEGGNNVEAVYHVPADK